jgi:hypothetical protein
MALVRCTQCAERRRESHSIVVEPIGYPNTALICGTPGCFNPGLVLLRAAEAVEYRQGRRDLFPLSYQRNIGKVRVKPPET